MTTLTSSGVSAREHAEIERLHARLVHVEAVGHAPDRRLDQRTFTARLDR
jgi:hypothetical protein